MYQLKNTQLWYCSADSLPQSLPLHLLNETEIKRMEAITHPGTRLTYCVGRIMTRKILGFHLNESPESLIFKETPERKPYLDRPNPLHFNISHSGHFVAVAVSPFGPVGVDVEDGNKKRDYDAILKHFFHANEFKAFLQLPPSQHHDYFFTLWTLKEAILKRSGQGLANGLNRFAITLNEAKKADVTTGRQTEGLSFYCYQYQRFFMAVAEGKHNRSSLSFHRFTMENGELGVEEEMPKLLAYIT